MDNFDKMWKAILDDVRDEGIDRASAQWGWTACAKSLTAKHEAEIKAAEAAVLESAGDKIKKRQFDSSWGPHNVQDACAEMVYESLTPARTAALDKRLEEARRGEAWKITDARIDEHTAHCVDCKTEDAKFIPCYRLTVLRNQLRQERALPLTAGTQTMSTAGAAFAHSHPTMPTPMPNGTPSFTEQANPKWTEIDTRAQGKVEADER